jgi:Ca2+-binding RTX toxin-like protein
MARIEATIDDRNLESTPDADQLDGAGLGGVTADYGASDEGVNVHLGDVDDRGLVISENVSGGFAEGDQLTDIQNIAGSAYNDSIRADSGDNMVRGGRGNDEIFGRHGDDVLWGGQGHDVIYGDLGNLGRPYDPPDLNFPRISNNDDTLRGGEGRDHLYGQFGDDELEGGADADYLDGGERGHPGGSGDTLSYFSSMAGVTIALGEGNSEGNASGGDAQGDRIFNFENVRGSDHADNLTGNSDYNMVWGRGGNDTVDGAAGNDMVWGNAGEDIVHGGAGDDKVYGDTGDVVLVDDDGDPTGNSVTGGNDTVYGNAGDDMVYGGGGDDMVHGDTHMSVRYGGTGSTSGEGGGRDRIDGGAGDDMLVGGGGDDVFVFGMDHGNDTILDFTDDVDVNQPDKTDQTDKIDLSAFELDDFGDIRDGIDASASGNDVVIDLGAAGVMGGGMITLANYLDHYNLDDLNETDFIL